MNKNGVLDVHINNVSVEVNRLAIINSYMIALICSGSLIARIFNIIGLVEEGLYPLIVTFSLTVSLFSCMILTKFNGFQMNKRSLTFLLSIIILFLISYYRLDNFQYLNEYFLEFIFYG